MADWVYGGKSTEEWEQKAVDKVRAGERISNLDDYRALLDLDPLTAADELYIQEQNLFKTQPSSYAAWDFSRLGPNIREWWTGEEATTPIRGLSAKMSKYSDAGDSFEDQIKKMSFDDFVWAVENLPGLFNISAEKWYSHLDETDPDRISGTLTPIEVTHKKKLEDFKKVQEGTLKADTSFLSGFKNINELLDAQELEMQKRKIFGEKYAQNDWTSGVLGAIFMDPKMKPLFAEINQEISGDFNNAHGLSEDGTINMNAITGDLNVVFDSKEDALNNSDFFKSYMEKSLFLDTKPHYRSTANPYGIGVGGQDIYVDPVADMINKGKMINGKYVVTLNNYGNEFNTFIKDVVSKEDPRNVIGQVGGIVDLAIMPVSGLYTAIITAPYRGLKAGTKLLFNKSGKLKPESIKLLNSKVKSGEMTQTEMNGFVEALEAERKVQSMFDDVGTKISDRLKQGPNVANMGKPGETIPDVRGVKGLSEPEIKRGWDLEEVSDLPILEKEKVMVPKANQFGSTGEGAVSVNKLNKDLSEMSPGDMAFVVENGKINPDVFWSYKSGPVKRKGKGPKSKEYAGPEGVRIDLNDPKFSVIKEILENPELRANFLKQMDYGYATADKFRKRDKIIKELGLTEEEGKQLFSRVPNHGYQYDIASRIINLLQKTDKFSDVLKTEGTTIGGILRKSDHAQEWLNKKPGTTRANEPWTHFSESEVKDIMNFYREGFNHQEVSEGLGILGNRTGEANLKEMTFFLEEINRKQPEIFKEAFGFNFGNIPGQNARFQGKRGVSYDRAGLAKPDSGVSAGQDKETIAQFFDKVRAKLSPELRESFDKRIPKSLQGLHPQTPETLEGSFGALPLHHTLGAQGKGHDWISGLFTKRGLLKVDQIHTSSANMKHEFRERQLIKLLEKRHALIKAGQGTDKFNPNLSVNQSEDLKNIFFSQEAQEKTVSQLLKENKIELAKLEAEFDKLGIRTLLVSEHPTMGIQVTSFGRLLGESKQIWDPVAKRYKSYPAGAMTEMVKGWDPSAGTYVGVDPKFKKGGYVRQGYADPGGYVDKITGGLFTPFIQDLIAKDKGEKPRVETPYQIAQYLDEETDYMERMREGLVEPAKDYIDRVKKPVEVKLDEVLAEARHQLNPGKPVKFKWSELHRLVTQSPLIRKPIASTMAWNLATPLTLEAIAKDVTSFLSGKGVEDSEIKKVYPKLQAVAQGIGTVDYKNEDDYISAIDEINKAVDTGLTNLAFNSLDLVFAGIDLSGHTDFQRKLREEYSKMDLDKPETFLGKVLAFGTEMAVPYTAVIKIVNRLRKVMAVKGINTFATSLDDLSGVARATTRVSNIAKRVGVGAATFGIGDTFIGRYSAVHDMFENDPYLFMKGKEDVEGLSGRDLALANFRNRARFGADGAMIGGLFPLVGPPAWAITKGLTKHVAAPTIGVGAKLLNVPITLIADTLAGRIPYTKKMIPGGVGEFIGKSTGGLWGEGIRAMNSFIGKQIITRAALGGMDLMQLGSKAYTGFAEYVKPTAARQLPEFSKWRMFSVNSVDPLKQNLARIDNFLSVFRDIGKLTQDAFYLSTGSRMFVNSNMRKVEKYLDIIEKDAYKLAKGFENRYNKHNDSKAASQAYLEQVLGYLKGSVKLGDLPEQLRQQSKALKNHLNEMKTQFKELLPEGSGLRTALDKSLSEYMRKSFATFTNPNYYPGKESVDAAIKYVSQIISKNPILVEEARMAAPGAPTAAAIKEYAQLRVADIMKIGKWEIDDPILALTKMARRDLDMEDIVIKTGEELPSVIRKLLGEENNLRASVMQTASSVVEQSATKRALDTISKLGTEGGWLFNTAEEALSRGKILNAQRIEGNPGTGLLVSDIIGKYTTPELAKQFSNVNLFDSWLKSKIYQNLIAFKAMVQGGKTLYSPATQARNFGSASLFALNQGHIGGASTVTEAFKMVADDIFGAGKNINQQELLEHIARKVRLGVIDENIVANELGAVLRDLKRGEVAGLNSLFQRVGEKKMSKLVQRLYAGGDNVWKWYGHEYLKSQLTGSIKSLDEVARYFQNTIGRKFNFTDEFTGKTKTLAEGIEEMAAYMVRETYPTYSKVPPVIQALRKFPFGNFISFPAEMLRTSVASAGLSLKHIASDNAALRSLGYRGLLGQMTTLYGVNETSRFIAGQLTGIDQRQIDTYTNYLGPSYMRNHVLIPLTSKNKQGNFKVFDMSAYNPYDFVLAPIEGVIKNLNRDKLDPAAIEEDLLGRVFDVAGPMAGFMEPFIAETIGLQPFFDVMPAGYALGGRSGVTKSGKLIYGPRDTLSEKFNKSFSHILESVAPGVITTSMKMYQAAAGEIQQGEKMDLGDQLFKLMGGSTMVVNPTKSLDYAISNIQKIRGDVFKTTHFYTDDNWENRPPAVMVEELENIQRNAFRAQYDVWKMLTESIDSGLITQDQAEQALKDRGLNKFKKKLLWYGEFTPVNISEDAMEKRAENIQKAYPDEWINPDDLYPKWQLKDVIDKWKYQRFEDYELDEEDELQKVSQATMNVPQNMNVASGPVETPPLPDTGGTPAVPPNINMAGQINPATGLTQTEDALLSPTEKLIRQRQRNRGVV